MSDKFNNIRNITIGSGKFNIIICIINIIINIIINKFEKKILILKNNHRCDLKVKFKITIIIINKFKIKYYYY
jgi:hypothetical protein